MSDDLQDQIDQINENYKADGWDGIITPKGWYHLIIDAHEKIKAIKPNYKIQQVKEKFGTLRYYCSDDHDVRIRKIIADAEYRSSETCQFCGNEDAKLMCGSMWYVTSCTNCAEENELQSYEVD